jgi:hypothetical protein
VPHDPAAGTRRAATRAGRAAALHAKGVVVYGAFATPPTALIIRARNGRTLAHEDLGRRGAEQTEYCEGYAEP